MFCKAKAKKRTKKKNQAKLESSKQIPVSAEILAAVTKVSFFEGRIGTRLCFQLTLGFCCYFLVLSRLATREATSMQN